MKFMLHCHQTTQTQKTTNIKGIQPPQGRGVAKGEGRILTEGQWESEGPTVRDNKPILSPNQPKPIAKGGGGNKTTITNKHRTKTLMTVKPCHEIHASLPSNNTNTKDDKHKGNTTPAGEGSGEGGG